jgi:hypothetical protein
MLCARSGYDEIAARQRITQCAGRRGETLMEPSTGRRYAIRLCSGELRCWRFEGADARGLGWWRDVETGLSFSEASLMYAWQIEGEAGEGHASAGARDD